MRETLSIDKNFITDEVTKSTKLKSSSNVKGKVTVSLFDENGNKEREVYTENLSMDIVKKLAYDTFYRNVLSSGEYTFSTDVFPKYLLLMNDDRDENSKDMFLNGDMIGYAGRKENYSGSDTFKGTFNSKESSEYIDEDGNFVFHNVYDFPTHAANGNINSIGFASMYKTKNKSDSLIRLYNIKSSSNVNITRYSIRDAKSKIIILNDAYYDLTNINIPKKINLNKKINTRVGDLVIGNIINVISYPSYILNIDKFDLDGNFIENIQKDAKTIILPNGKSLYNYSSTSNFCATIINNFLFLVYYYDNKINFVKLDFNFNIISMTQSNTNKAISQLYETENGFNAYIDANSYIKLNKTLDEVISDTIIDDRHISTGYLPIDDNIYLERADTNFRFFILPMLYTKTKLPSSVMKTSTQTMKVQYDFIFKPAPIEEFFR